MDRNKILMQNFNKKSQIKTPKFQNRSDSYNNLRKQSKPNPKRDQRNLRNHRIQIPPIIQKVSTSQLRSKERLNNHKLNAQISAPIESKSSRTEEAGKTKNTGGWSSTWSFSLPEPKKEGSLSAFPARTRVRI